jgi:hypothetical protein
MQIIDYQVVRKLSKHYCITAFRLLRGQLGRLKQTNPLKLLRNNPV